MAKLPSLVAVVILSTPWQAQTPTYAKGDTVRLMVPPDADALPDSTVIAVPGIGFNRRNQRFWSTASQWRGPMCRDSNSRPLVMLL
jgi:hypothetical protein